MPPSFWKRFKSEQRQFALQVSNTSCLPLRKYNACIAGPGGGVREPGDYEQHGVLGCGKHGVPGSLENTGS